MAEPGTAPRELPTEVAYRATLPDREALGTTGLLRLNVSVERAVTTVLGCLPALRGLREELLRCLSTFNVERFDRLEQYALALLHAQVLHRGRVPLRRSLAEQARELAELRERLLADARSLARHGLLREEGLQLCKRSRGYRALADDVFLLVELFREQWSSIEQRTPASMELLQQASRLSLELLRAVGARQHGPAKGARRSSCASRPSRCCSGHTTRHAGQRSTCSGNAARRKSWLRPSTRAARAGRAGAVECLMRVLPRRQQ